MKHALPLVFTVIVAASLFAQQQKNDPAVEQGLRQLVANVDAERKQIMQLLADYEKAFRARDINVIMEMYSPDVVAYDIAPPLEYKRRDAYRKSWENFFAAYDGPIDMEIREQQLRWSGGLAMTNNLERFTGTLKGGQRSETWVRVTDLYEKKDGKWRIIHEHVSVPTDFSTGKAALDLKP